MMVGMVLWAHDVFAQVTPAGGYTPPDDTPRVSVGGVFFGDYTYTFDPKIVDADGNRVSPSAFNVTRTYINVTGQVHHLVAFRITPDITRETGTGSSLNGSMTFRLKYGYAQLNLDDWMWRGSYVRAGKLQTPYVDFEEGIYRYRFQGTVFVEREGFLTSADDGVAFHTNFPNGYGDVMAGYYNGEGYQRVDPNDQKAFQIRGSVRPLPGPGVFHGLRVTGFYDADHYIKDGDRRRFVSLVSFEHKRLNAGWTYLDAADQTSITVTKVDSKGTSFWVNPKAPKGIEGLFRYDRLKPNDNNDSKKERWIAGVAWWPPVTVPAVNAAFLLDFEQVRYHDFAPARPTENRLAVHMLITFQ
jgi:hypothetical protein